jgi:hypothetical protein
MAPLPHDQDITSWPQLLRAIEDAEAGQGTARLTEICLSVYSALAVAQFQITQLKARVHVLAASRPRPRGDPMTVRRGLAVTAASQDSKQPGRAHHGSASRRAAGPRHDRERAADHRSAAGGCVRGLYQIRLRHAHAQAGAANRLASADHPHAPLAHWLTPPRRSSGCAQVRSRCRQPPIHGE